MDENGPFIVDLPIYLLNIMIFHCYVSLPEGNTGHSNNGYPPVLTDNQWEIPSLNEDFELGKSSIAMFDFRRVSHTWSSYRGKSNAHKFHKSSHSPTMTGGYSKNNISVYRTINPN